MASAAPKLTAAGFLAVASPPYRRNPSLPPVHHPLAALGKPSFPKNISLITPRRNKIVCMATEVSVAEESSPSGDTGGGDGKKWVPVVPLAALPRGERRVIIQDGETILLLWYKNEIYAIENRSPAEGAYSEGLLNAKLTQDGCIVCPTTDSTYDLRNGSVKDWYPNNPVLRFLTPSLRNLFVYPAKTDGENIYISMQGGKSNASAEIVFSGKAQPGFTATDVYIDEVRMVVDESAEGFGFTGRNESINGKAATIGFLLLLDFELLTGKGFLKGTGILDFIYSVSNAFNVRMVVDESAEGFGFTGRNESINGKAATIGFLLLLDFELLTGKGFLKGTGFLDFIYSVSSAFN